MMEELLPPNECTYPALGKRLLVITGPTAVGKTEVAVKVAKAACGEIVSADSIQVYRGMNIGSAKPSADEMCGIPHHMIDVVDPCETFNVARYRQMAEPILEDIWARGRRAILTGGTGLYISSIIDDFYFPEEADDAQLREALSQRADRDGLERLYAELQECDPDAATRIHPNDRRRIIRALEVCTITGAPTSFRPRQDASPRHNAVIVALTMPREALYRRIEARVERQIEDGLVAEVRALLDGGCRAESQAMQGLGYKEIAAYLQGECTLEEAVSLLKRDTRRYAKRQLTWWRRDSRVRWLDMSVYGSSDAAAMQIIHWWLTHD